MKNIINWKKVETFINKAAVLGVLVASICVIADSMVLKRFESNMLRVGKSHPIKPHVVVARVLPKAQTVTARPLVNQNLSQR